MGPGFKYHVATIAAIFFALTTGLVVGSLIVSPRLVKGYAGALKGLRITLNQDIENKSVQLSQSQKFVRTLLPLALQNRLEGQSVAIVQTGSSSESLQSAEEALKMAGARISAVITPRQSMDVSQADLQASLQQIAAGYPGMPLNRTELAARMAKALLHGDDPQNGLLVQLQRGGLISLNNDSYDGSLARYVVMLAGGRGLNPLRIQRVDAPLAAALIKQGAVVVMAEPQNTEVSDVPLYHNLGLDIATIDNMDTRMGQFSLIYALRGHKDDYGQKSTAHALLPPLPTTLSGNNP